jgi:hypothetical protein
MFRKLMKKKSQKSLRFFRKLFSGDVLQNICKKTQTFFHKIKCTNFLNIRYAVRKSYPINRVRFPNGVTNV